MGIGMGYGWGWDTGFGMEFTVCETAVMPDGVDYYASDE
jgi:hypothetical protein